MGRTFGTRKPVPSSFRFRNLGRIHAIRSLHQQRSWAEHTGAQKWFHHSKDTSSYRISILREALLN